MPTAASANVLTSEGQSFGALLKSWRAARKLSQLELALDARVSQRHLSFLESGRAQPSREMVVQLANALDIPLRDQNLLLQAAGFAALYRARPLDSGDMQAVRHALELTLAHHEPFPAVVVDRTWDLVMANTAATRLLAVFGGAGAGDDASLNIMRMTFHPEAMQPLLGNWEQVAPLLLSRLQREVAASPSNAELAALLEEVTGYPGIPRDWQGAGLTAPPPPTLSLELVLGDTTLKMFSMISTFGTAQDVTADELRVETFFPADDATERFFRAL